MANKKPPVRPKWTRESTVPRCIAKIAGTNERQCAYEGPYHSEQYGVSIDLCKSHDEQMNRQQIGKRYGTA
jgi:hypothetical protein